MSQPLALSGDVPPACDLCHARKIKCDRRSPCANCTDAGAECQRLRRGRSAKKRAFASDFGPDETVIEFEQPSRSRQVHNDAPDLGQVPRDTSPASDGCSAADADDSNYHAIQAKSIIQLELDDSRFITIGRQSILKTALQLVSEIAENERRQSNLFAEDELLEELAVSVPELPPREMLFMLLRGPRESIRIQWPDHISEPTYERIAAALLDGSVKPHEQLFHRYCVCVYVRATTHLYHLYQTTDNTVIRSQISQSRSVYTAAALKSIQYLNILRRPDLSTIQCLISSALLMQYLCRLNQCWVFISYAAKQIVSLNYHRIRTTSASTDHEQEIYSAVYWCYYLDRTLSSLLGRPPSLPDLQVSPTDLIPSEPSSPYDTLIRVVLDLAQIQGKLHAISCCDGRSTKLMMLETCQQLESQMQSLLSKLQSDRNSLPESVQHAWIALDFCYFAIFVEIYRTRLKSSFSPLIHRLCLLYAQNSLKAFLLLLEHPAAVPGVDGPCPSFLTWTLLIYPLSPFFVVFCNAIGTLNKDNYKLMQRIIDGLGRFSPGRHFERLLNLLQSLQLLCDPLFQEQAGISGPATPDPSIHTEALPALAEVNAHIVNHDTTENRPSTAHLSDNLVLRDDTVVINGENVPSADWVMWDLFNSQVPAGWLNSDF
ncbi:Zn(II)2Cys6 transcription factor [Aspergillus undulatus]|uniref:Zn(II)2Cys6 transcription factor n=1 Tax=Aspergillus undulatus TaxID=1810928 RepID=UPI003CCDC8A1